MKSLSIRNRSRFVCAAATLLGMTLLTGINAPQVQARPSGVQAAPVTVTSVSAPTRFNSGDTISLSVGVVGGSTRVHVTSFPAGVIEYTATVSDDTPFTVPTSATVSGASTGQTVPVTIRVTVGTQTIQTTSDVTATRTDLEPIFPQPIAGEETDTDLEPIFPKPSSATIKSDLEPIFPQPNAGEETDTDLEPIFPQPVAGEETDTDLEPIFPKPIAGEETDTDLKPAAASTYSARLHSIAPVIKARSF